MIKLNTLKRTHCIVCNNKLSDVKTIKNFPIFMGTTNKPVEDDLLADMKFCVCENCGCVQLGELIPLDVLYSDSHSPGVVGKSWQEHHKKFSDFVLKYAKGNVVEIGGSNLILANHLQKSQKIKSISVYDTNIISEPANKKIILHNTFFNSSAIKNKPDAIIHSHVIEHLYDPFAEINEMCQLLDDNSHMIISMPIIDSMMISKFSNAMNFEHTYGLTVDLLKIIASRTKLKIIDIQEFNEYCCFVALVKDSNVTEELDYYFDNNYIYDYFNFYEKEIKRINNELLKSSKNIFIFGGHIFTQFLLSAGLDNTKIINILDNDERKQNKRLYGTNFIVKSPKILKNISEPVVVLKAGQYTEEIKSDILENINPRTKFIL